MIWLVSLIALTFPTYLIRFSFFGIPTTAIEILLYLSFLALFASRPVAQIIETIQSVATTFRWPLVLLIIGTVLGIALAPDLRQALGLAKAYILDPLVLLVILGVVLTTRPRIMHFIWSLVASGTVVALTGITGPETADGRALGLFALDQSASPNFIGLFLAPLIPISLYLSYVTKQRTTKLISATSLLLMVAALVDSGSRGALLAAGTGSLLLILWLIATKVKSSVKHIIKGLMFALVLIVLVGGYFMARPDLSPTPSSHRTATSNNLRYEIWRTTLEDIIPKHWLLGVGLGNYQAHFSELTANRINYPEYIAPWALTPHNLLLTVWLNLGLAGLAGFAWLLIIFFKTAGTLLKKDPVMIAITMSMVTLLIHGLVDTPYWKNDLALIFWSIISLPYLVQLTGERHDG